MELNRLQIADFLPDRSMAAYEMHLADEVPWHGHEFYECTMIVSGTGKHRLNGEELTLQRGDVFVLTPGDFHAIAPDNEEALVVVNIIFKESCITKETWKWLFADSWNAIQCQVGIEAIENAQLIYREYEANEPGAERMMRALLEQLLICIFRQVRHNAEKVNTARLPLSSGELDEPIRAAQRYIHHRFRESITLQSAAKQAGWSPPYFSERFKKATGMTFQIYVQQLRLQCARTMLAESDWRVTEICYASGFNNLAHFERVYKKRFGCSPRDSRQGAKG
ncbi:AraC family transcriptional regulator [Paenibacillus sp. OSY-SE]|uniref:AraC family transcriptional regulator n=1 Tax=Paenibacillus sp. OSY-SE TaxID=1196323 RepID=UPI000305C5D9|nr:AraC family transcriptional regulator [Paenibacillus sp. OSY-SE]